MRRLFFASLLAAGLSSSVAIEAKANSLSSNTDEASDFISQLQVCSELGPWLPEGCHEICVRLAGALFLGGSAERIDALYEAWFECLLG